MLRTSFIPSSIRSGEGDCAAVKVSVDITTSTSYRQVMADLLP